MVTRRQMDAWVGRGETGDGCGVCGLHVNMHFIYHIFFEEQSLYLIFKFL